MYTKFLLESLAATDPFRETGVHIYIIISSIYHGLKWRHYRLYSLVAFLILIRSEPFVLIFPSVQFLLMDVPSDNRYIHQKKQSANEQVQLETPDPLYSGRNSLMASFLFPLSPSECSNWVTIASTLNLISNKTHYQQRKNHYNWKTYKQASSYGCWFTHGSYASRLSS
jgi:hypothetical protein